MDGLMDGCRLYLSVSPPLPPSQRATTAYQFKRLGPRRSTAAAARRPTRRSTALTPGGQNAQQQHALGLGGAHATTPRTEPVKHREDMFRVKVVLP